MAEPNSSRDITDADRDNTASDTTVRDYRGTGIVWGGIVVLLLLIALIIVAIQNAQDVEFDFLWIDTTAPLVLILVIAIAAAIVIDEIIGFVWRRRRRSRLQEREELRRLRKEREGAKGDKKH